MTHASEAYLRTTKMKGPWNEPNRGGKKERTCLIDYRMQLKCRFKVPDLLQPVFVLMEWIDSL